LGDSPMVGGAIAKNLSEKGASVTICNKETTDNVQKSAKADILVSATGVAGLVTEEYINPTQIIVDVGISVVGKTESGRDKIAGDISEEIVDRQMVSAVSPVPGGVGPMTVAALFQNLFEAYNKK
jgi:methylenetetrahydrofolate dehydrogenase (NADP+)/methenyltetrahydrofolate cyclohydrolase